MHQIKASCGDNASDCNRDYVRVICDISLARNGLRAEMYHQDHVIELEDRLIEEDC